MIDEQAIQTVADNVREWAFEVCQPEALASYDFAPLSKDEGLPDVAVEVLNYRLSLQGDERLPQVGAASIQQALLAVYDVEASIMVEQGTTDAEAQAAARLLRRFTARLADALLRDTTLGGRVQFGSPELVADFVPQFVRYEDGTRGRQVRISLVIGELVGG